MPLLVQLLFGSVCSNARTMQYFRPLQQDPRVVPRRGWRSGWRRCVYPSGSELYLLQRSSPVHALQDCSLPGDCLAWASFADQSLAYIKRDETGVIDLPDNAASTLERRGKPGEKPIRDLITGAVLFRLLRAAYPSAGVLYRGTRGDQALRAAFGFRDPNCNSIQVQQSDIPPGDYRQLPGGPQRETEHPVDSSYKQRMIENALLGRLPSGGPSNSLRGGPIPREYWENVWATASLPPGRGVIGEGGIDTDIPNARADQALGTNENRHNLLLTDSDINGAKGNFFYGNPPMREDTFGRLVQASVRTGNGESAFLQPIRAVRCLIQYFSQIVLTVAS